MASVATDEHRGQRRRLVFSLAIALLAVSTVAVSLTGAYFTDTATVDSNTFATGNVTIGTSPTSAMVGVSGMAPGDSDRGGVTVSNDGSLELRYAVTSTTDEDTLAGQLDLWVWLESDEDDATLLGSDNSECDATPGGGNVSSFLYEQGVLGSTGGTNVIGDPATGGQTGDRTLAASTSEVLCFYVELPSSTGNTYEDLTSTATLTFDGEQTANNA